MPPGAVYFLESESLEAAKRIVRAGWNTGLGTEDPAAVGADAVDAHCGLGRGLLGPWEPFPETAGDSP